MPRSLSECTKRLTVDFCVAVLTYEINEYLKTISFLEFREEVMNILMSNVFAFKLGFVYNLSCWFKKRKLLLKMQNGFSFPKFRRRSEMVLLQ